MPLKENVMGTVKTFFWLIREELDEMDHKMLRIGVASIIFILSTLLWYFLFNGSLPF